MRTHAGVPASSPTRLPAPRRSTSSQEARPRRHPSALLARAIKTALRRQESGAQSHDPVTGKPLALGLYQFTPATLAGVAKAHPDLGLTDRNIFDPAAQERAVRALPPTTTRP